MQSRRAFTLVQLLLVLAVSLVSAAVLFTAFTPAPPSCRPVSCTDREKEINLAFAQYLQDANGLFPPVGPNDTSGLMGNASGWADSLGPYLRSSLAFQCPQAPELNPARRPSFVDYGYNSVVSGRPVEGFAHPSNTVLLFDCGQAVGTAATASLANTARVAISRHLDGANCGFLDGHLKWLASTNCPSTLPATASNFTFDS